MNSPNNGNQPKKILVAGIGNIFFGDDAFGVEVVGALSMRKLPDGVVVRDFGIRGFDLACALVENFDTVVLVDAISRNEPPGTLFVIEPEINVSVPPRAEIEAHSLNPMKVLDLAHTFGAQLKHVLLVGCEPAFLGSEDEGALGLSEPVAAAVTEAVWLIESLIAKMLTESHGSKAAQSTR
ncbi:MAG: hydrogenase maturation protease [Acidobacteria bacterium]|nr:hydrogenase maturation protease [Acidobacteriota bacterium]